RQRIVGEPRGRAGTMRSSVDRAEGRAGERRGRDEAPGDVSRWSLSRLVSERTRAGGGRRHGTEKARICARSLIRSGPYEVGTPSVCITRCRCDTRVVGVEPLYGYTSSRKSHLSKPLNRRDFLMAGTHLAAIGAQNVRM